MELYESKINNNVYRIKDYFYKQWNNNKLWNIDSNTNVLLNLYLTNSIKWDDWLNHLQHVDNKENEKIFNEWWEYCDEILETIYLNMTEEIDFILDNIINWPHWKQWSEYSLRLNYYLTQNWIWKFYQIKKFTLFPNAYTPYE